MVGTTLSTERYGHTATVLGNALYIQGGLVAQVVNNIERSMLGTDGSLGPFTTAPRSAMATVRTGHTNVIVGNYLYTLGGLGAAGPGGALSAVERATINTGGAINTFAGGVGTDLQDGSESHASAVIGNHLYVFGGLGSSAILSRVERADIAADGSLGSFAKLAGTVLSTGRYLHTCAVAGNHVYLIGGRIGAFPTLTIDHTVIAADGTLGFIEPASVELQIPRQSPTAVTIGNHLYVIGGIGDTESPTTVERADIAADGSLGGFSIVPGVNLSVVRSGHTSVVLGSFLYNLGGISGSSVLSTVERATIKPDGSLGPFAIVPGVTLKNARAYHASVVVGNYLYVLGGEGLTQDLDSVERSAIAADGSLGTFAPVPGIKLATTRTGLTAVALTGQIYVLGGSQLTSVERAALGAGDGL
jgi:Kelch motif